MNTFNFLAAEFPWIYEDAAKAESEALPDPRTSCFYARRVVELTVNWIFKNDPSLHETFGEGINSLIGDPEFIKIAGDRNLKLTNEIIETGNKAVHEAAPPSQQDSVAVISHLFQFCFWFARTYARLEKPSPELQFDPYTLPRGEERTQATSEEISKLEEQLAESDAARLAAELAEATDEEIQAIRDKLRADVEAARLTAEGTPDLHDYTEEETRALFIDLLLQEAGWPFAKNQPVTGKDKEFEVKGMPNKHGIGFADYVLWGDNGLPLAVVEAKKARRNPNEGQEQSKLYADCLEQMFGQRPVIYWTNGFKLWIWDDFSYPPRLVQGFYTRDELDLLFQRRISAKRLSEIAIDNDIVERPYQHQAIRRVNEHFENGHRRALLVMATGTGKTRVSVALADQMIKANQVKRVLFLTDRTNLVKQADDAFRVHLKNQPRVNLVSEKDVEGRIFFSTYQTMIGLISSQKNGERRFGVGYFDLIFIDEAHRSIFRKYAAILDYFDARVIGLTATPREDVDHDTYATFGLRPNMPTDAYTLDEAIADGFLVPAEVIKVTTKFLEGGIKFKDLSPEEQERWNDLEWDEDGDLPDSVNSVALNKWLFNKDTVDKVLENLMRDGIKVDGGDRLGKTIIFAANQHHAEFIVERFDANYPNYKGSFARVITYKVNYAQSLIDAFKEKDKAPHVAVSVDMLDTGVDVPEVVNLVFFKRVRSKTKFWQMIGRGTRLCPSLFAPGQGKTCFQIFDFCGNFEFFDQNPNFKDGQPGISVNEQRFQQRVDLVEVLDRMMIDKEIRLDLLGELKREVNAMNVNNFIVRPYRQTVEEFQRDAPWNSLGPDELMKLKEIAALPTQLDPEPDEAKRFDVQMYRLEKAYLTGDSKFDALRSKVIEIASLLEEMESIPVVSLQMVLIQDVQGENWWQGVTLQMLEVLRKKLRGLVHLIERRQKTILYTDFEDVVVSMSEQTPTSASGPRQNFEQFKRKAREYFLDHESDAAVLKIHHNYPVDSNDIARLTDILMQAGIASHGDIERAEGESGGFGFFIRSLVGLDRAAAKAAMGDFLDDKRFSANQIDFINLIIDDLTVNGVVGPERFYESPFTDIAAQGPQTLFSPDEIEKLIARLAEVRLNAAAK